MYLRMLPFATACSPNVTSVGARGHRHRNPLTVMPTNISFAWMQHNDTSLCIVIVLCGPQGRISNDLSAKGGETTPTLRSLHSRFEAALRCTCRADPDLYGMRHLESLTGFVRSSPNFSACYRVCFGNTAVRVYNLQRFLYKGI